MPTPRRFDNYPAEYGALIMRTLRAPNRRLELWFRTKGNAVAFRNRLYAYRRALISNGEHLTPHFQRIALIAPSIAFSINDRKLILYVAEPRKDKTHDRPCAAKA